MKIIQLTRGYYAKVDDEDFELLNQFLWNANGTINPYATRTVYHSRKNRPKEAKEVIIIKMHRQIMQVTDKTIHVDHINGNTLDNRKINLRLCVHSENSRNRTVLNKNNSSGFRGVSKVGKSWVAYIHFEKKKIHLGTFKTIEEAADAFDKASLLYFKEYQGYLNIKEVA